MDFGFPPDIGFGKGILVDVFFLLLEIILVLVTSKLLPLDTVVFVVLSFPSVERPFFVERDEVF